MTHDGTVYRPDIDGLRAIAVLAVLAFHLKIPGFDGGFVGVDIFFVISGFLITQLILKEIDTSGRFRFRNFYVRRIRRLFPALLCTQIVTLLCGILWLSPAQLERMGGAMVFSLVSLSNFFFWSETGYFNPASDTKPLLHTWSLGVEEQFYLFWPLLLFIASRPGRKWLVPSVLAIAGAVSLWLNLVFGDGQIPFITSFLPTLTEAFEDGNANIFFLTPFRVFEFAIGALMVWIAPTKPRYRALPGAALVLGIGLMLYPVHAYDSYTPFPTIYALIPCGGAALAIYGGRAPVIGALLSNPLSVLLGRISYSLYLVHWPLIVYWQVYFMRGLTNADRVIIAALTLLLAWLLHRLIEQRFRHAKSSQPVANNRGFLLAALAVTIAIMAPAAAAWRQDGWAWRVPNAMTGIQYDVLDTLEEHWNNGIGSEQDFNDDQISAVVIGVSFGLDVAYMLREHPDTEAYYPGTTGYLCRGYTLPPLPENFGPGMKDPKCAENVRHFARDYPEADVVILVETVAMWDTSNAVVMDELLKNVGLLRENGFDGPVVIYGERPVFLTSVPQLAFRYGRRAGFNRFATDTLRHDIPFMKQRVEEATQFYAQHGIYYYSPVSLLCPRDECDLFTPDDALVYIDTAHFTPEGDAYLAQDFVEYLKTVPELASN